MSREPDERCNGPKALAQGCLRLGGAEATQSAYPKPGQAASAHISASDARAATVTPPTVASNPV